MRWLKNLLRLWRGDPFREAIEGSKRDIEEANGVFRDVRASLNGEADWLYKEWGCGDSGKSDKT